MKPGVFTGEWLNFGMATLTHGQHTCIYIGIIFNGNAASSWMDELHLSALLPGRRREDKMPASRDEGGE